MEHGGVRCENKPYGRERRRSATRGVVRRGDNLAIVNLRPKTCKRFWWENSIDLQWERVEMINSRVRGPEETKGQEFEEYKEYEEYEG